MLEFVPTLALIALVYQLVGILRSARGKDWNGVFTPLIAMVAGVLAVLVFAQTDFASGISVGDMTLASLNFWSLVLVGITVGTGGSVVNDTLGAVDSTRSTAKPHLLDDGKDA